MEKEEIHFGDINRWLFGQTPPIFMLEVCIRTILIYLVLLLIVRLMGKRMTGQITITEMAVMVTLGAIVSPVMQLPDRGVIYGVISLFAALFFQRGFNWLGFKSKKIEEITQGEMSLLVKDGTLVLEEMDKTTVTKQQLYAMLREKKIHNLGKVKRAYLEACGVLSVYTTDDTKAGLPIFPTSDNIIRDSDKRVEGSIKACCNCGHLQNLVEDTDHCKICDSSDWSIAYLS